MKKEISLYSGIPLEHIKLNLGHEELMEDVVVDTASALPFFLFNTWVNNVCMLWYSCSKYS